MVGWLRAVRSVGTNIARGASVRSRAASVTPLTSPSASSSAASEPNRTTIDSSRSRSASRRAIDSWASFNRAKSSDGAVSASVGSCSIAAVALGPRGLSGGKPDHLS